ncbi:hypothetical protein GM921_09860 [Pedobacter sp. LMG 31464]|uniref:MORN repeat variant n=1 Tax=Pedobacter planticolens TaxID=2679964 RepID=A0A923E1K4_9SPHI|nr:hypothetical protein [Pedobacter planticolens]MBB2145792.1 hypothetical protein [Pedobacter planticolens]
MRLSLFTFFLVLLATGSKAQYEGRALDLEHYQYTLGYPDHKITFYARPAGESLKFTDPAKNYYWFSSNELKITQGGFSGKLLHGSYTDFYLNKNLKEQGEFRMGLKNGIWNRWTEVGVLVAKVCYKDGLLEGRFYQYDSLGQLAEAGKYRQGKINGKLKKYISSDSIVVMNYKNGLIQPAAKKNKWFQALWKKKTKSTKVVD